MARMLIENLKPVCYGDVFWNVGSVFEVDENTGVYFIAMRTAKKAADDAVLSAKPDMGPERRSIETIAMEKAAASIVSAVANAAKPTHTAPTPASTVKPEVK